MRCFTTRFLVIVMTLIIVAILGLAVGVASAAPIASPPSGITPQDVLLFLKATLVLIWSYAGVKVIVGHVLINVVVALAAAQYTKTLDLSKLAEFLTQKLLPFIAVYVVCKVFGDGAGLPWLAPATWVIIESTLAANLIDNLGKLGVPLPNALARVMGKRSE